MQIPKPSERERARFLALVPDRPDVVVRPMFGNLGAYVNGNMFMGSFGPDIGVRPAPQDREELLSAAGAGPFGPAERPMAGYVSLPSTWEASDERAERWIGRALDHASTLPVKSPKPRRRTG